MKPGTTSWGRGRRREGYSSLLRLLSATKQPRHGLTHAPISDRAASEESTRGTRRCRVEVERRMGRPIDHCVDGGGFGNPVSRRIALSAERPNNRARVGDGVLLQRDRPVVRAIVAGAHERRHLEGRDIDGRCVNERMGDRRGRGRDREQRSGGPTDDILIYRQPACPVVVILQAAIGPEIAVVRSQGLTGTPCPATARPRGSHRDA